MHSKQVSDLIANLHAVAQAYDNGMICSEAVNVAMLAVEQYLPGYADSRVSWPSQLPAA